MPMAIRCRELGMDCRFMLLAGLAFMFHGYGKIQNPFGWMGPNAGVPGVYLCVSVLLLLAGPGRFSVDRVVFGENA